MFGNFLDYRFYISSIFPKEKVSIYSVAPFNNSDHLQGLFLGLLLSLKSSTDAMTCRGTLVVWDSKVDGQMDGCAQGCVKEGALKIGFLSMGG